jgi:hypothetical protein
MTVKRAVKIFSMVALVFLVFLALGPGSWQPRSGLGWELDHFVGYFIFTWIFLLAWPRPLVVGGALVVFAFVLENLQSLLPDRSSYFVAALYSAAGVTMAALLAELLIRARRQLHRSRQTRTHDIEPYATVAVKRGRATTDL